MGKNIWLFNHYAATPEHTGLTRHYDFARELVKRGHSVTVFCSSFIHYRYYNLIEDGSSLLEKESEGVKFVYLNTPGYSGNGRSRMWNMLYFAVKLFLATRKYPRPDIIYSSSPHLLTPLSGCFVSKRVKAKHIMEVRDLWPEVFIEFGRLKRDSIVARVLRAIEKYCCKAADAVVVTLPGAADYIRAAGVPDSKMRYINNGVDLELFDNNRITFNANDKCNLSQHDGRFVVVYAGAHGVANDLETLLKVASRCGRTSHADKIDFILIGDGMQKQSLRDFAEKHDLKNVFFYDSIDKKYIPSLLTECDVMFFHLKNSVLFTKYGISPNKLFDYLASGRPVLSNLAPYNDIVKEANAGFSVRTEGDEAVQQMTEALIELYEMSPEERAQLGANGRAYVEEHHSIPKLVDKLEALF